VRDEFQRLADSYSARRFAAPTSRLDLLMDIERIRDPRVVPFLLAVLRDPHEADDVRVSVHEQLRHGNSLLFPADRMAAAVAIGDVLAGRSGADVRVQAALALGPFTRIDGVLSQLNAVCLARDESIDLRYAAFTSLERAGPTQDCIGLLRRIASDDTLGGSARNVLSAWHVR
jgi:hypothetical protein